MGSKAGKIARGAARGRGGVGEKWRRGASPAREAGGDQGKVSAAGQTVRSSKKVPSQALRFSETLQSHVRLSASCPPVFWTLVEVNPASPHTPHLLVGCLLRKAPTIKHLSLSRATQRPAVELFKSLLVLLLCNHGWDITTHGKTELSIFCLEIIVTEERLQSYT